MGQSIRPAEIYPPQSDPCSVFTDSDTRNKFSH
jgi:hypothetical protein